mmetsp:Transcript_11282/g.21336  ORF Transcript_11282/g.21336 Transcript_11282/m.21336 type:complete len:458 (+) Transcript_11282:146-1519(+)
MVYDQAALSHNEHHHVHANHFPIGTLTGKDFKSPAQTDWHQIFVSMCQCGFIFALALLSYVLPWFFGLPCAIVVACILLWRCFVLVFFVQTVKVGKYTKMFYMPSVIFWGWWPAWMLIMCCISAVLGLALGIWCWDNKLWSYFELKKLQRYTSISPTLVPGERLQDSGLVDFWQADLDRANAGCFMQHGNTYCVAPIVKNGEVTTGLANSPRDGSYDYFAVGINCCTCPDRDFKCGEWMNPFARGGIRSLDARSRPYYRLAVDDWSATYRKAARHPLFFEWVQDPHVKWMQMWNRAYYLSVLGLCFVIAVAGCGTLFLDCILKVLLRVDIASRQFTMAPLKGWEPLAKWMLPRMYHHYIDGQVQMMAMQETNGFRPWNPLLPNGGPVHGNRALVPPRQAFPGALESESVAPFMATEPGFLAPSISWGTPGMPLTLPPSAPMMGPRGPQYGAATMSVL